MGCTHCIFCLLKGVYIPSVPFFELLVYMRKKEIYILSLCLAGSFHQLLMINFFYHFTIRFSLFICLNFLYWLIF